MAHKSILTVSDIPRFANYGGMVELAKDQSRLRLKINLERVKQADITIAAPVLSLATLVTEG